MSPARMSKFENSIRLVLEYNEAFNHHDVTGMMRLISPDGIFESPSPSPNGTAFAGREVILTFWDDYFRECRDVTCKIEDIFSQGFHCVMRWRRTWVNPAGETRTMRGVDVFKIKEDLICENYSYVKG
jgi:predicted SnoaL-like aldol condensation-catalyzing enzyme